MGLVGALKTALEPTFHQAAWFKRALIWQFAFGGVLLPAKLRLATLGYLELGQDLYRVNFPTTSYAGTIYNIIHNTFSKTKPKRHG